jgi:hypothetical protein
LFGFAEAGALNALWTRAGAPGLADSVLARFAWTPLGDRLRATSVRWLPSLDLRDARPDDGGPALGPTGDTLAAIAALDPRLWHDVLRERARALARWSREYPGLVPAVVIDLPELARGAGFGDATFAAAFAALPGDSASRATLLALPAPARYDSLLESGRLEPFYDALERAVAERAAALRADVRRVLRDFGFVVRAETAPADWFTLGLLRGLGDSVTPVVVLTSEARTAGLLARYRGRGIAAVAAVELDPRRVLGSRAAIVLRGAAGYWVPAPGPTADSLAQRLRALTMERGLPEGPDRP